jgi:hypothetical protein
VGIRALPTLAALVVVASAPPVALAGGPGSGGGASTIAWRICTQAKHDLGAAAFTRTFGGLGACERKAGSKAQTAVASCLRAYQPATDGWRRCIDARVAAAAKSLESWHR